MAKKTSKPRALAKQETQADDQERREWARSAWQEPVSDETIQRSLEAQREDAWLFPLAMKELNSESKDFNVDSLDAGSRLRWQSRNKCLPAEAIVKEGMMSVEVELFGKKISFIPDNKEELDYLKSKMKK